MKTATDYWMTNEHIGLARAYVEGNRDRVERFNFWGNIDRDVYSAHLRWARRDSAEFPMVYSITRVSRTLPEAEFFILPPALSREAATAGFYIPEVANLIEPAIVRFGFERTPGDIIMTTYYDPVERQTRNTAANIDYIPGAQRNGMFVEPHEPFKDHQARTAWLDQQDMFYAEAMMLKHFTSDLDYDVEKDLMPLATARMSFAKKLTLVREEMQTYIDQGLSSALIKDLLPN